LNTIGVYGFGGLSHRRGAPGGRMIRSRCVGSAAQSARALGIRFCAGVRNVELSEVIHGTSNVHEALYAPAVEQMIKDVANASGLRRSIISHHTTIEEAGRIAHDARVKTLVLSHLVPAEDPIVPDQTWIDVARRHFAGRIIVGKDLLEI
jgi:hypothetical protein